MYDREYIKWGIRAARSAQKHPYLAGVVYIADRGGKGFCRIRFNEDFVVAVGKALPYGVSVETPAYLKAVQSGEKWKIFAFYLNKHIGRLLWVSEEQPSWIQNVKRTENGAGAAVQSSGKTGRKRTYPAAQDKVRSLLRGHLRRLRYGE